MVSARCFVRGTSSTSLPRQIHQKQPIDKLPAPNHQAIGKVPDPAAHRLFSNQPQSQPEAWAKPESGLRVGEFALENFTRHTAALTIL
jgi:hypothetical protein